MIGKNNEVEIVSLTEMLFVNLILVIVIIITMTYIFKLEATIKNIIGLFILLITTAYASAKTKVYSNQNRKDMKNKDAFKILQDIKNEGK